MSVALVTVCFESFVPACDEKAAISKEKGQVFLQMLHSIGMVNLPNQEELVFHLCDMGVRHLQEHSQREQAMSILDETRKIREQREARSRAAAEAGMPPARLNEYESAKSLYRAAAAQILINFLDEKWDGREFTFVAAEELQKRLPELSLEFPGYSVHWEILGIPDMHIRAEPREYGRDGYLSFLLINANGMVYLRGGDFCGKPVVSEDPRTRRLNLNNLEEKTNGGREDDE